MIDMSRFTVPDRAIRRITNPPAAAELITAPLSSFLQRHLNIYMHLASTDPFSLSRVSRRNQEEAFTLHTKEITLVVPVTCFLQLISLHRDRT